MDSYQKSILSMIYLAGIFAMLFSIWLNVQDNFVDRQPIDKNQAQQIVKNIEDKRNSIVDSDLINYVSNKIFRLINNAARNGESFVKISLIKTKFFGPRSQILNSDEKKIIYDDLRSKGFSISDNGECLLIRWDDKVY